MAQDVTNETLKELQDNLKYDFTLEEIKAIVYSAYSYSTAVDDTNINDSAALSTLIDWKYFADKK